MRKKNKKPVSVELADAALRTANERVRTLNEQLETQRQAQKVDKARLRMFDDMMELMRAKNSFGVLEFKLGQKKN